jgi:hypothetical protein
MSVFFGIRRYYSLPPDTNVALVMGLLASSQASGVVG